MQISTGSTPRILPTRKRSFDSIHQLIKETEALDKGSARESYAGPALLTGRAAAVFLPRGFRTSRRGIPPKRTSAKGQTFTSKVGEKILPDFISIKDDPTESSLGGQMLLGSYSFR